MKDGCDDVVGTRLHARDAQDIFRSAYTGIVLSLVVGESEDELGRILKGYKMFCERYLYIDACTY